MGEEIEQAFNERRLALDMNEPTFEARTYSIGNERKEKLDELESR